MLCVYQQKELRPCKVKLFWFMICICRLAWTNNKQLVKNEVLSSRQELGDVFGAPIGPRNIIFLPVASCRKKNVSGTTWCLENSIRSLHSVLRLGPVSKLLKPTINFWDPTSRQHHWSRAITLHPGSSDGTTESVVSVTSVRVKTKTATGYSLKTCSDWERHLVNCLNNGTTKEDWKWALCVEINCCQYPCP